MENKKLVNQNLSNFDINPRTQVVFKRFNIKTLDDIRKVGLGGLMKMGINGLKLDALLFALDSRGVDFDDLFFSKDVLDESMLNVLNTPISKIVNDKKILYSLFTNKMYRVKNIIYVPSAMLTDIFQKSGVQDAHKKSLMLQSTLYSKLGVRVDEKNNLLFNKYLLDHPDQVVGDDVVLFELDDIPTQIKRTLLKSGISLASQLETVNLDKIYGIGPEFKRLLQERFQNKVIETDMENHKPNNKLEQDQNKDGEEMKA